MPAFHRLVSTRTEGARRGTVRTVARVDDFLHGFEVTLDVRDGAIHRASATAHRHPWTTCPGALASVAAARGPLADAAATIADAPRDTTCVHVNDLVWLAARQHPDRRYEMEIDPFQATLERDGREVMRWPLHRWQISGTGPFAGLSLAGTGWAEALAAVDPDGADGDGREAVRVLRRGLLVAVGYYTLDWRTITRGTDVPRDVMADTCHTFSGERTEQAVCLAEAPDRRSRPR